MKPLPFKEIPVGSSAKGIHIKNTSLSDKFHTRVLLSKKNKTVFIRFSYLYQPVTSQSVRLAFSFEMDGDELEKRFETNYTETVLEILSCVSYESMKKHLGTFLNMSYIAGINYALRR